MALNSVWTQTTSWLQAEVQATQVRVALVVTLILDSSNQGLDVRWLQVAVHATQMTWPQQ